MLYYIVQIHELLNTVKGTALLKRTFNRITQTNIKKRFKTGFANLFSFSSSLFFSEKGEKITSCLTFSDPKDFYHERMFNFFYVTEGSF